MSGSGGAYLGAIILISVILILSKIGRLVLWDDLFILKLHFAETQALSYEEGIKDSIRVVFLVE